MQTIVRHRDEGMATWFLNGLAITKVTTRETGGAYGITEQLLTPDCDPPLHLHHDEDEAFYVLEGEVAFEVGGDVTVGRRGSFAFAPHGVPHRFSVRSETARMLVLTSAAGTTPANGGFERFHQAAGVAAGGPVLPPVSAPDPVALTAIAAAHGIEILPPPT
jgi:quercetin dioxygenase-like cupin family protein